MGTEDSIINSKVIVQIQVSADGKLSDIKIINRVNKAVDDEIIRVIKKMPKWTPAKKNGKNVSSILRLPIIIDFNEA